jgi:hypothetical protein
MRLAILLLSILFCFCRIDLPDAGKDRIIRGPYLQGLTANSAYVLFHTVDSIACSLKYGLHKDDLKQSAAGKKGVRHKFFLPNLLPDTRYYYSLGGTLYSFVTLPDTGGIVFAAYGDSRSYPKRHRRLVDLIQGWPDIRFILHSGDFVKKAFPFSQWDDFVFKPLLNTLGHALNVYPAAGNHEFDFDPYQNEIRKYFHFPPARYYYAFDAGFTHFVSLDFNLIEHEPQTAWLMADLEKASLNGRTKWIVVQFHQGYYTAGNYDFNAFDGLRRQYHPILRAFRVAAALQGHIHLYQRTRPIDGVTYLTVGTGGATFHQPRPVKWIVKSHVGTGALRAEIEADRAVFKFIDVEHHVIDSFSMAPRLQKARTSAPVALRAEPVSPHRIKLSWTGPDSACYAVYRNKKLVYRTIERSFTDEGLAEKTRYQYLVKGVTAEKWLVAESPVSVKTPADNEPLKLIRAVPVGDRSIALVFQKPVNRLYQKKLTQAEHAVTFKPHMAIDSQSYPAPHVLLTAFKRRPTGPVVVRVPGIIRGNSGPLTVEFNTALALTGFNCKGYRIVANNGKGTAPFSDRDYKITEFPDYLKTFTFIQSAHRDMFKSAGDSLRFSISRPVEVVLACGSPKRWMQDNWQKKNTGPIVYLRDHGRLTHARQFSKRFYGPTVAIPGNIGGAMYFLLLRQL